MSKTVLITGSTSGVGKELCFFYEKKGWEVWALGRDKNKLKNQFSNTKVKTIHADLLDLSIENLKKQTKDLLKLDLLINNAGLLIKKSFLKLTNQEMKEMYEVNIFSIHTLIQELHSKLSKASIINIGSAGGVTNTLKFPGMSGYSSSKAALSVYTECLATELAEYDISINCLALGAVETPMLKQAFPSTANKVTPLEMAEYIYNFSISSKIINGQTLIIAANNP